VTFFKAFPACQSPGKKIGDYHSTFLEQT